jgi:hypothetical protein
MPFHACQRSHYPVRPNIALALLENRSLPAKLCYGDAIHKCSYNKAAVELMCMELSLRQKSKRKKEKKKIKEDDNA